MRIIRNNVAIELTSEELFEAYQEQERLFTLQNIRENMVTYINPDIYEEVKDDERFMESAAYWLDKYEKDYGCEYEYSLEQAFNEALQEREERECNQKESRKIMHRKQ